jgi:hypothetical protein
MLTKPPACRVVCTDSPGAVMDELVEALAKKRNAGLAEADALSLVGQAASLVRLFPEGSLGQMPAVAESFVTSGCATCAVNKAYAKR